MTRTLSETFGVGGADLATETLADPTSAPSPIATTRVRNTPPANPLKALTDPHGSAIFWIALAAILGLVLVTGQVRLDAKLGGRAGRGRR
jgi:hypothetical protein